MSEQITLLKLDQLHAGPNIRRTMDTNALNMLARSISASGVHEPLIVRPNDDGYEIVAGHRRHAAAQIAEVDTVPVIIRDLGDEAVDEIMLVENLQREDLLPSDESLGFSRLVDHGWSVKDIADKIGRSQAHVAARIRLMRLPRDKQEAVDRGDLTLEKADALAKGLGSKEWRDLCDLRVQLAQWGLAEENVEERDQVEEEALDELEDEFFNAWRPERFLEMEVTKAKRRVAILKVRDKVNAKGYELIEQTRVSWPRGVETLDVLGIDPKAHRNEDCHAFGVSLRETKAVELCVKMDRHKPDGPSEVVSPLKEKEVARRKAEQERIEAEALEQDKRREAFAALIAADSKELDLLMLYAVLSKTRLYDRIQIGKVLGFPDLPDDDNGDDARNAQFEDYVTASKANARRAVQAMLVEQASGYQPNGAIGGWNDRLNDLIEEVKDS